MSNVVTMRLRGMLAATALVVAGLVPGASAKGPEFVAYEIVPKKRGATGDVLLHVTGERSGEVLLAYVHLKPYKGHYDSHGMGIGYYGKDGTHRSYGMPASVSCPPPACGAENRPVAVDEQPEFTMGKGDRLLFAATRGIRVTPSAGWVARPVANAFRVVTADRSDASGLTAVAGSVNVEHFRGATVGGGRYGSSVFATVPCDLVGAGGAELSFEGERAGTLDCPNFGFTFGEAWVPGTWTTAGDVVGDYVIPIRLLVFDHPKP